MKKIIYLAGIFLLFTACKNDDGAGMANLEYEGGEVSVKIEEELVFLYLRIKLVMHQEKQ